jgi:anti-sigma factor RsiW
MTRHVDPGWLQDFVEGLLEPEKETEVSEHLAHCAECRLEAEAISRLRSDLENLGTEAEPPRDLWPQIEWRLSGSVREATVGQEAALAPGGRSVGEGTESRPAGRWGRGPWRITLPAWQLLAAGIALVAISGGSVWAILSSTHGSGPIPEMGLPGSPAQLVEWEEAYLGYDQAVSDLEAVLDRGRELLDAETVRVLEENLKAIDAAIQEASEALMKDPASPLLQRFLADNMRRKVDLLRQAAGAVYATT